MTRAAGRDIVELFGYTPDDQHQSAKENFRSKECPFVRTRCSKTNHDQSIIYGVCSVTNGIQRGQHQEVIICPKRMYQNSYEIFEGVVHDVWGSSKELIVGGDIETLREKMKLSQEPVVAFGQASGNEISVNSNGRLSMDWVLQSYKTDESLIGDKSGTADEFVGIEVQSIDITGNYRENWHSYCDQKITPAAAGSNSHLVPASGHGLNWANVHKRLIPQIIRKGNIYKRIERCAGFYFLVPEIVYQVFEEVIGKIPEQRCPSRNNLSVKTFSIGPASSSGNIRPLLHVRDIHLDLDHVSNAFINNFSPDAPNQLDTLLKSVI
jgi:hypothetical protein